MATTLRALHLFSNWRWTGPAEPAVNLCAALRDRGVDVQFACGQEPADRDNAIRRRATELGLPVLVGQQLRKHHAPIANARDAAALASRLAAPPDVIHAHLLNDHLIALKLARRLQPRPHVVRSFYIAEALKGPRRTRAALARGTDAAIVPCQAARDLLVQRLAYPAEQVTTIEAAIDTGRFDPNRSLPDLRPQFGLLPEDLVLGVIARIQPHRQYQLLVEAVALAAAELPRLKLLVLGRGPDKERLLLAPARRLGVADRVACSEYRWHDDFVAAVACFDASVFLVPGTDGTCRAIREAMAMAKPVIGTRRGIIPELIDDGQTGLIVDEEPQALARAIVTVLGDPARCRRMGQAAWRAAERRFPIHRQACRVHELYQQLLATPPGGEGRC